MLMGAASTWLPRLATATSIFYVLVTLHYFYSPAVPRLKFDNETDELTLEPLNDTLVPLAPPARPIYWIPEKHWQIWRTNIADFQPTEMERMRTWRHMNPFHRYEVFSHESAETFVRGSYAEDSPDVVAIFLAIKDMIIRADFTRYLILYHEGGVYSDIDTKALRPIHTWIPEQYKNRVNAVIGLEIDDPGVMWGDWADNFVFCQSTLMVSPGHRIYEILIGNILKSLDDVSKEKKQDIGSLDLTFQDVLRITGPVAFTDAVLSYFTEAMGETITRANFTGIIAPKQMADVLVMPTVSFVPGQPHSRSGKVEDKDALVQHMGMGSWRDTHKLESTIKKEKEEKEKKLEIQKQKEADRLRKQAQSLNSAPVGPGSGTERINTIPNEKASHSKGAMDGNSTAQPGSQRQEDDGLSYMAEKIAPLVDSNLQQKGPELVDPKKSFANSAPTAQAGAPIETSDEQTSRKGDIVQDAELPNTQPNVIPQKEPTKLSNATAPIRV